MNILAYCILVGLVVALMYKFYYQFIHQPFVLPRTEKEKERLDELIRRGDLLVEYLKKNKYPTPEISSRIVENWDVLKKNEKIGITPSNTDTPGFVINKNDAMQLCVTRSPKNPDDIDDLNLGTFVIIHEIAHLGALEYQHGEEFISVFKKLLRASIDIGIWKYTDYGKNPQWYCEYYVNATPVVPEKFETKFD
jgi:ssRNA-specific RNase YbeY (16S rRNA maturation enzyme)